MKCNYLKILLFLLVAVGACKPKMISKKDQIEKKVDSLLNLMTLEEKVGQMIQIRHFEENADIEVSEKFIGSIIHTQGPLPGSNALEWQQRFSQLQEKALATRLGIPLLFGVDAVHGQNTFEGATIFPHNIGLGATHNEKLVEQCAKITAIESQATGFNWVFSPCVAIPYNEKWGRVYEAFSESSELTTKLTKASVKGHQGNLEYGKNVIATAKHFVGDGSTDYGIEGGETTISQNEVHQRLLAPYKAAVEKNIGAIMASFNKLDGISMHAHKVMITDTLKVKMGFEGIVVSDWKAYSRFGGNDVINAGVDVIMAVDGDLDDVHSGLIAGIKDGSVKMSRIDDAVRRVLRQKFRLNLFNKPFPSSETISFIGSKEHRIIAKQAVRESLVLLKNNKVLPISKQTNKIVVVGEHANSAGLQSGGWTVNWQGTEENYKGATTILDGIKKQAKGKVAYDVNATQNHEDADLAIVVVGEPPYAEFFGDIGHDSNQLTLTLSEKHQNYINYYKNKGIKTLVVLISGRPMVVTNQIEQSDAFVAAWLPGSEGEGVAEVLFGDNSFKGKLPHSWPKSIDDFESNKYGPNFWDKTIEPLYPFGYGLQY